MNETTIAQVTAAFLTFLTTVIGAYLTYRIRRLELELATRGKEAQENAVKAQEAAIGAQRAATDAAVKVEEVKLALTESAVVTDTKLADVAAKVEQVHKATNSLTDRLVASTEKEAHERGTREERERSEEKGKEKKT